MARAGKEAACRMVAAAHRAPEGNRRLHRRQGRVRIPLRQALRRQTKGPRRGPFTVESLSPHRVLAVDENDELIDGASKSKNGGRTGFRPDDPGEPQDRGVQQAHKEDKITFSSITPWPGKWSAPRAAIWKAARHREPRNAPPFHRSGVRHRLSPRSGRGRPRGGDAGFDVLVACAFNYDARSTEFDKLGRIPVLKARMNADLHMADDLKNTGKGNLFVIFGEPDIDILNAETDGQIQVKVNGVDVFHPNTGEVRSDGAEGSPAGSSTPTTTRRASSSATPISWARTILTRRSRPRSRPRSTRKPGPR